MKAVGLSGAVAFFRPGAATASSRIRDLTKAARYQVVEADNEGPVRKRWLDHKLTAGKGSRYKDADDQSVASSDA
jgi:hypothetical protein